MKARSTIFGLALALLPAVAAAQGPLPDSLLHSAQRLIRDGDARGIAVLDSVVRTTREGTLAHAQALYWRATSVTDSTVAENDLLAIAIDHALTPYAADALLRLGQKQYQRGARAAAIRHFERLVLEHRASTAASAGWFWLGLARIDNKDFANGCVALDSAKRRIPSSDVELLNRVNFVAQECRALADTRPPAGSAPPTAPPDTAKPAAPAGPRWSAQAGAFKTNAEADRLVAQLKAKGHATARVDKVAQLYHVRVGLFATRADAAKLVTSLKSQKITAFVVEAPRREP